METRINHNYQAWSQPNCVEFYSKSRHKVEDLYPSESSLLLPIIKKVSSVLDVGCAAGGFYAILKTLNPNIKYVGIDTATKMIEAAKTIHPEGDFRLVEGGKLPFADNSFDLVLCTGVLHHVPEFKPMIADLYRVATRFVFADLPRLTSKASQFQIDQSNMILKKRFTGETTADDLGTRVPYTLTDIPTVYPFLLKELFPRPAGLASVGYYGTPDESITIPVKSMCFNVILLAKQPTAKNTKLFINLPEDFAHSAQPIIDATDALVVTSIEAAVLS